MNNLTCPFCKEDLVYEYDYGYSTYVQCRNDNCCVGLASVLKPGKNRYYRYHLEFNKNDELISYSLYVDNNQTYIKLSAHIENTFEYTGIYLCGKEKPLYLKTSEVKHFIPLNFNDPINSYNLIVNKLSKLKAFQ